MSDDNDDKEVNEKFANLKNELGRYQEKGDPGVLVENLRTGAWRYAWARAVARAWIDPEYERRLIYETETALKEVGFAVDWGLKITVRPTRGSVEYKYVNTVEEGKRHVNGWQDIEGLSGEVIMVLPPRPEKTEHQAIALADYEATARTYPFTTAL